MRGLIGMLAGAALAVPAVAGAPGTMTTGTAPVARPGGWGAGGWNGVRPGGFGFAGRPGFGFAGGPGFVGYRRPFIGYVVPNSFISPTYYIGNWSRYGLASPAAGYGWYRYYDDAVMVDGGGRVRDWRGGIDWNSGGGAGAELAYDDGYDDGYEDGFDDGIEDAVTYRGDTTRGRRVAGDYGGSFGPYPGRPPAVLPPPAGAPLMPPPPMRRGWNGYGYAQPYSYSVGPGTTVYGTPDGATVVVVRSEPAVTTTTTTTSYETVRPKRVWHAPVRRRVITKGKTLRR